MEVALVNVGTSSQTVNLAMGTVGFSSTSFSLKLVGGIITFLALVLNI